MIFELYDQHLYIYGGKSAGMVGGSEFRALSSTFNTTTEVSLSKAPNPKLLPGCRSINGCPLLRVCVHGVCVCSLLFMCTLDGLNAEQKFRVWVTILVHMLCHFHFHFIYTVGKKYLILS